MRRLILSVTAAAAIAVGVLPPGAANANAVRAENVSYYDHHDWRGNVWREDRRHDWAWRRHLWRAWHARHHGSHRGGYWRR